jgi:hypothetical protein
MASLESQLSLVAEGIRIKISLSPKTSALQMEDLLTGLAVCCTGGGIFPISIEGNTERLFGPDDAKATDCVTVTVRVCVFTVAGVDIDVILGTGEDRVFVGVDEIETAGMTLLFTEMAGGELT